MTASSLIPYSVSGATFNSLFSTSKDRLYKRSVALIYHILDSEVVRIPVIKKCSNSPR